MTSRFRRDDSAVTAVIGTILVLAIITMLHVTMRVEWAPVWEAEAEAAQAVQNDAQFAGIWTHAHAHVANGSIVTTSDAVQLAPERASVLMDLPGSQHGLEFTPDFGHVRIEAASMTLLQVNGTSTSTMGNDWTSFVASTTIQDVRSIHDLRLRVGEISKRLDDRQATVTLTDAVGTFAGRFTIRLDVQTPDLFIFLESRNAAGEIVTSETRSIGSSTFPVRWLSSAFSGHGLLPVHGG